MFKWLKNLVGAKSSEPPAVVAMRRMFTEYEPPDAETQFFWEKYQAPLVRFLVGGYRTASDLSPLQELATAFAFPLFRGRAVVDPQGSEPPEWTRSLPPEMANDPTVKRQLEARGKIRRRFSGDPHNPIPRGRYVALVGSSAVAPTYGLLGEMNAYAVPHLTGYCAAVPVKEGNGIEVVFRGLPGEPNPLHRLVTEPRKVGSFFDNLPRDPRGLITPEVARAVPSASEYRVAIPTDSVISFSERVFDMRLPVARRWMIDFFRDPPPAETNDDLAHGGWLKILAEMYRVDLSRIVGWRQLLPIVSSASQGGNAMTDLFAAFLRRMGCTGIVYPSARSDYGVIVEDGRVKDSWGWLFVDYAGSPLPTRLAPEHEQPLQPLTGVYHTAEIESGRLAGSMAVIGCSLNTRLSMQMQFDHFALHQLPTLSAAKQAGLRMRSSCWFLRDYSAGPDAAACDSCKKPFSFRDVAPLRQCPSCHFSGDLGDLAHVPMEFLPYLKEV